jgi:hypothetical protein
VVAQGILGAGRIALPDRSDYRRVLLDHLVEVHRAQNAEATHAIEVHLGALAHRPHCSMPTEITKRVVKLVVEDVEGLMVRGLPSTALAADLCLEPGEDVVVDRSDSLTKSRALQRLADELRLSHLARADSRHKRSDLRHDFHEPLLT